MKRWLRAPHVLVAVVLMVGCYSGTSGSGNPSGDAGASSGSSDSDSGSSGDGTSDGTNPSDPGSGDSSDGATPSDDAGGGGSTPTVCTSGKTWTRGDLGSSSMHPGRACISCHDSNNGPSFDVAGTVYPTVHEPDDCNGAKATGAYVLIHDAHGVDTQLSINAVGNFYGRIQGFAAPFTAKVVSGGKERAMAAHQSDGDCNGCHTEGGKSGAPGRIQMP